jgi:hypothetical protein
MTGVFEAAGRGWDIVKRPEAMRQQAINGWKLVSDREKFNILDNLSGYIKKSTGLKDEQKNESFAAIDNERADILAGKYRDRGVSAVEMEFQKQAKEAFGIDDNQAAAWMAMLKARAVTKGMTAEEYLQQNIAGIQAEDETEFSSPSSETGSAAAGPVLHQVDNGQSGDIISDMEGNKASRDIAPQTNASGKGETKKPQSEAAVDANSGSADTGTMRQAAEPDTRKEVLVESYLSGQISQEEFLKSVGSDNVIELSRIITKKLGDLNQVYNQALTKWDKDNPKPTKKPLKDFLPDGVTTKTAAPEQTQQANRDQAADQKTREKQWKEERKTAIQDLIGLDADNRRRRAEAVRTRLETDAYREIEDRNRKRDKEALTSKIGPLNEVLPHVISESHKKAILSEIEAIQKGYADPYMGPHSAWYAGAKNYVMKKLRSLGGKRYHKSGSDISGSVYYEMPGGQKIRLSDHVLPQTEERAMRGTTSWDEIVLDNIITLSQIDEKLAEIIPSFNPSATGKGGDTDILYQEGENTPVFNSKLKAVVEEKMGGAMEADALLAMLKNSGVKDEEIAWSGLGDLSGKVDKQTVLDTLADNAIEVEEVVKGGKKKPYRSLTDEERAEYERLDRRDAAGLLTEQEQKRFEELGKIESQAIDASSNEYKSQTKYGNWVAPGGENYKELLLTLPGEQNYRGGHFDESNILAHVRFNERTDTQGNRVLFIEEIQSDWHQAGREQGYTNKKEQEDLFSRIRKYKVPENSELWSMEILEEADVPESTAIEWWNMRMKSNAVPDAPFKKNWHELAFKRMLRWAAENGFDKVAWTSGVQQVRRYENAMRQQVDRIDMVKTGTDTYAIIAAKGKAKVSENRNLTAQQAREQIGKAVFDKLDAQIQSGAAIATVQGDDLTVGGEGMKGFYDKILPEFAKKYVKKWGAQVGTTQIQTEGKKTETVHAVDITDMMVDSVMAGQWLFQEEKLSGRQKAARKRAEKRAGDTLGASIRDKMVADYAAAVAETGEYQAFIEGMTNIITQIVLKGNIGKIDFGSLTTEAMEYIEGKPHLKKYVAKPGEDGQAFDEVMDAINAEGEQGEQHGNAGGARVSVDSPMELLELLDLYETGGKSGAELHAGAVQAAAGSDDPVTWLMANIYRRLKGGEDEDTIKRFIADSVAGLNDSGAGLKPEDFWDIGGRKIEARKKQIKKSVKKAAAEFLKDGKVILHAFSAADFSSLVHETAHLFRRELEPELLKAAEDFCGVENGQWTVAAEEKFARSFERYLWEGKTANQQLKAIFAKFREWLRRIYLSLKDSPIDIRLSDDIKRVFDKMLAGPAEIHPGEMTFDEFYARLGKELEDYGSGWMERYGLQSRETPHQMHSRLKKEWSAMQAASTLGEKLPKDYLGSLTVEQQAQLEEIEKAAADVPSAIWQQEKARQVGDLIEKSNADELVVMEVQKQLKKAFEQGQKVGAERQKDYLKELLRRVRARKVLREHIRKLAKQIAAPAPGTVDLFEREAIAALQAGFDPSFRMDKTLADRQRIRQFLERYPDKQMPRSLFETINKKALNELTIKDIEEMAHQRAKLEKQGKLKAKLKAEQDERRIETITGQIIAAVEAQTKIRDKSVKPDAVDPADITLEKAGVEKGRPLYWLLYKGDRKSTRLNSSHRTAPAAQAGGKRRDAQGRG